MSAIKIQAGRLILKKSVFRNLPALFFAISALLLLSLSPFVVSAYTTPADLHYQSNRLISESDGNGVISSGETASIKVTLNNAGGGAASLIYADLTTAEPKIHITSVHTNWSGIAAGTSLESTEAYTFSVDDDLYGAATFNLNIYWINPDGTSGSHVDTFQINVRERAAKIVSPLNNSILSGTITLSATLASWVPLDSNTYVHFYDLPPGTTTWQYLGAGTRQIDGSWTRSWDTTLTLKGVHQVRALVNYYQTGSKSEYSTNISYTIDNPVKIFSVSFNPTIFSPNGDGIKDSTTLSYTLSEAGTVTTKIYDSSNNLVRTLENFISRPAGQSQVVWDGKDDLGLFVPTGVYTFIINATDSIGNPALEQAASVTVDRTPVTIVSPSDGSILAGTISLVANVSSYVPPSYNAVVFYYQPSPTASPNYWTTIGTATKQPDGSFLYSWDTTKLVDGAYKIRAEVGQFGIYSGTFYSYELSAPTSVTIDNPIKIVSFSVSPSPFSSNGDSVKDTTILTYTLSEAGTVTTKIYDSSNTLVRTLENFVSRPAGQSQVSWDGKDDLGLFVPSGIYTIRVNATDSTGNPALEQAVSVIVDRAPVTIVSPPEGSTLAGTVTLVANISPYIPSFYNAVRFSYQPSPTAYPNYWYSIGTTTRQPDGSFLFSWDTTKVVDGSYKIRAEVGQVDSWGSFYNSYELSTPVSVTVDNPIRIFNISLYPSYPSVFSPNGDGRYDTAILYYTLSEAGTVTAKVYDSSNTLVRTLENLVSRPGGQSQVSWDGKDDLGLLVPSGVYTFRINAVDSTGNPALEQAASVTVDRTPVTIISPSSGSSLAGTVTLVANISAYIPSGYNYVNFYYQPSPTAYPNYWTTIGMTTRQPDGSFIFSWDTTKVVDGSYKVRAEVGSYGIYSGTFSSYELSAPVLVTIDNPIKVFNVSVYPAIFSPNSDGRNDMTVLYYTLSEAATVTTRIYDSSNTLVRTLENAVSRPASQNHVVWDGKDDLGLFVPTGVYTFRINATDSTGNPALEQATNIIVDRTPVTIISPSSGSTVAGTVTLVANVSSYVPSGYNAMVFYYQPSPTAYPNSWNWIGMTTRQPDGSFLFSWDTTKVVDGAYKVRAEVGSYGGGGFYSYELSAPVLVTIDNSLPSSAITSPANNVYFNASPILITGTCQDPSGDVGKVEIKITNTKTGEVVVNWQEAALSLDRKSWSYLFIPQQDSRYQVQGRAVDLAANTETPLAGITLTFDTTPPLTTDNSDVLWHNQDVVIKLSPTDTDSGVSTTKYQLDATSGSWSQGTTVTIPAPLDHMNDGFHTVYYYSTDGAGNAETVKSCQVRIDTTPPTTSIEIGGTSYGFDPIYISPQNTVSFVSTDQGSGVLSTLYRVATATDPGSWQVYTSPFRITTAGDHTIYFKSTDNLGQVEVEKQQRVYVDIVPPDPPTGLVIVSPRISGVLNLSWNPNTEQDIAGYNVYRSTQSQTGYQRVNPTLITQTFYQDSGLIDGKTYYYVITAVDKLGAESYFSTEVSGVPTPPDNIPPLVASLTPAHQSILNTPIAFIQANLSDEGGSGVDFERSTIKVEVNGLEFPGRKIVNEVAGNIIFWPDVPFPDNTYTVTVTPVDKAQNTGISVSNTFIIDTKIPATIDTLGATPGDGQVVLSWLSPSDEGPTGKATSYIVKQSLSPIYTIQEFNSAVTVPQNISPQTPGSQESVTVSGLTNGRKYYFAIRTIDQAGNLSQVSNLSQATPQPVQVVSSLTVSRFENTALVTGDSTTVSLKIKNTGNTFTQINSISSSLSWLSPISPLPISLDLNQEKQVSFTASVPADITEPTTYQAPISITSADGGSFSTSVPITIQTTGVGDLPVKVVDSTTGIGLSGATVILASGETVFERLTADTFGGVIFSNHMRGDYIVSAYQPGYAPKTVSVSIKAGQNSELVVRLEKRQFIMTDLVWRRLELPEIQTLVSQGVLNISNPQNYNVYTYTASITVVSGAGTKTQSASVPTSGYSVAPSTGEVAPPPPTYATIIVPVEIKFLKEHFEVTMVVKNNADPGVVLKNTTGHLNLPADGGVVFASTTPPQTADHSLGDIPAGSQASTSWLVRGEIQGEHSISANLGADLFPFNQRIDQTVQAQNPIKVYAGSALKVTTLVPDQVKANNPFKVKIGLTNVSPVSVYYASISIKTSGLYNCVRSPGYQFSKTFIEIKPGQTVWAKFGFISLVDGYVVATGLNTTGGNVKLEGEIRVEPGLGAGALLQLYARDRNRGADLNWESFSGASYYKIYRSTSVETLADAIPVTVLSTPASYWQFYPDRGLTPNTYYWYAVTTVDSLGEEDILHNIASAKPFEITPTTTPIPGRTGVLISSGSLSARTINPYSGSITLVYTLLKTANVTVHFIDESGFEIRFLTWANQGPGDTSYVWTGVTDYPEVAGRIVLAPRGYYKVVITAEDAVDPMTQDSLDLGEVLSEY